MISLALFYRKRGQLNCGYDNQVKETVLKFFDMMSKDIKKSMID
jgi:hypothetical protein